MDVRWQWPARRALAAGLVMLAAGPVSAPLAAQRSRAPDLSVGAGLARQPHDNSGLLATTGTHVQAALHVPVGDRTAARLTLFFEHFGVRSSGGHAMCDPVDPSCEYRPSPLPFALGVASLSVIGRSESLNGRLYGGAGAGVHHAFRSPWLGERTGFAAHAVLGASLGPDPEGLGIEVGVQHLLSAQSGAPWLVPLGLTWTF